MKRKDSDDIKIQTLEAHLELKKLGSDDAEGTFEGYASVFKNRDSYNEAVMPGAFTESLVNHKRAGTYPLMLWQHRSSDVCGKWDDLAEDSKGLYCKGRVLPTQLGKDAYILLKEKAVQGLSIGYREVDVEPSTNGEPRKLLKVDLLEISIVSFAANQRARVEEIKSMKRFQDFVRALREGKPLPCKDFEDILREAGVPKDMACQIASVGYAKAIRRESEGTDGANALAEALEGLNNTLQRSLKP